jgi:hypothetical protein
MSRRWRIASEEIGQSVVELVAAAPVLLLCGALGMQALAAGATYVYSDNAAHAGALAAQLGRDPVVAARAAVPGWSRGRVEIRSRGRVVTARLRPRPVVPLVAPLLTAESSASFVEVGGVR